MFFHIDESGNTGMNLFDANQRRLSYGVLSSRLNVDALGKSAHREMTGRLGVDALHANEMGVGGLAKIEDVLHALQKRFRFGQLSGLAGEPAALGAVILAAQGLAISRSLDGLPHLITAAEQHPGATTDILVAVAAYDDAQLASYARELQSLVDTSRSTRPMGAASAALDRLQSFADRAEP